MSDDPGKPIALDYASSKKRRPALANWSLTFGVSALIDLVMLCAAERGTFGQGLIVPAALAVLVLSLCGITFGAIAWFGGHGNPKRAMLGSALSAAALFTFVALFVWFLKNLPNC